jgi:hypothetical protein
VKQPINVIFFLVFNVKLTCLHYDVECNTGSTINAIFFVVFNVKLTRSLACSMVLKRY